MSWYLGGPKYSPELQARARNNPDERLRAIACCEKAKVVFCVCQISWTCEEHGRQCIGTHD